MSTQGIAVLANTLQTNGGAIRSAETRADAELPHVALDHDPAHKVDWQKSAPAAEFPSVSVSDARAAEGEAVEFTVSLSEASDEQVTVDYATSNGTAESGTDFTAGSGTLTFSANDTSETVRVETADDSADEEDETFTLTLSNPAGATLDDAEATGTIEDDDEALAALTGGVPRDADRARRRPAVQLRDPVQRGVRGAAPDGARGRGAGGDGRAPGGREAQYTGRERSS